MNPIRTWILPAVLGTALLAMAGCGGSSSGSATGGNTVTPSATLTVSPASLTLAAGGTTTVTATVARGGGFSGPVTVAVSGAPAGVSVAGGTIDGAATTIALTVTTSPSVVAGTYSLSIGGSATGATVGTAQLPMTVEAIPNSTGAALTLLRRTGALPALDTSTIVAGTDANADGVRDDIEGYIRSLPDTAAQKAAATGLAKALQTSLTLNVTDPAAVTAAAQAMNDSLACLWKLHPTDTAYNRAMTLQAFSVNTIERIRIYDRFNFALNGSSAELARGASCNV